MMEWMPIETGPRDGQRVLLFYLSLNIPVQFGRWVDREDREYGKVVRTHRGWVMEGGWLSSRKEPEPSHWCPLPDPPVE